MPGKMHGKSSTGNGRTTRNRKRKAGSRPRVVRHLRMGREAHRARSKWSFILWAFIAVLCGAIARRGKQEVEGSCPLCTRRQSEVPQQVIELVKADPRETKKEKQRQLNQERKQLSKAEKIKSEMDKLGSHFSRWKEGMQRALLPRKRDMLPAWQST